VYTTVNIVCCLSTFLFLPPILLSSTILTRFSFSLSPPFYFAQPWCMFIMSMHQLLFRIKKLFVLYYSSLDMYFLPIKMIIDDLRVSTTVVLFVILPIFYFIYYRKFRYFIFDQRDKVTKGKTSRGKCPPFFPNGKNK
jgi:hypothetical protein